MRKLIIILSIYIGLLACTYHQEIPQGNLVSQEQLQKVKPGMNREQVRFLIGSPLVQDPFHKGRWDYLFRLHRGKEVLESYRVSVHFEQDKVVRIEESGRLPPDEYQAGQLLHPGEE